MLVLLGMIVAVGAIGRGGSSGGTGPINPYTPATTAGTYLYVHRHWNRFSQRGYHCLGQRHPDRAIGGGRIKIGWSVLGHQSRALFLHKMAQTNAGSRQM